MLNILFIGNSFTFVNDLPAMLTTIAADAGVEIAASSVLKGGAYLHQFADPEHELGRRLAETYPTKKWDFIVLQDQSFNPVGNYEDFLAGAKALRDLFQPERLLLYQTWAYEDGTEKLEETGLSYDGMHLALKAAYTRAAEDLGAEVVPVGDRFARYHREHPEIRLYKEDHFHPSEEGTRLAAEEFFRAIMD